MEKKAYSYRYSFFVRGSRRVYLAFDNLEDLREEVDQWFSQTECGIAIVNYLTTFREGDWKEPIPGCGYEEQKHSWRNIEVTGSREETEG